MVSFDVVSLPLSLQHHDVVFTIVPLEKTINIIIKRIYDKTEINTNIRKQEIKELL